jgi:uncharacterized protein YqeY
MSLREQLAEDLKESMRNREAVRRTVIRNIMTSITEAEQRKRVALVDEALKKHNFQRASHAMTPEEMGEYESAIARILEAEQVEARSQLDDAEVLAIVQKLVKQRQDSIEEAEKAGREDIVASEREELPFLEAYLPRQLTREEIEAEARAAIEAAGASGMRDMGKVMGPLMERLKGQADGKLVSQVVRELLA